MAKKEQAKAKAPEGRVAAAAFTGGAGGFLGGGLDPRAIERAQSEATERAYKDGVVDPAKILKLKLAARKRVVDEHREAQAAAIAEAEKKARAPQRAK